MEYIAIKSLLADKRAHVICAYFLHAVLYGFMLGLGYIKLYGYAALAFLLAYVIASCHFGPTWPEV